MTNHEAVREQYERWMYPQPIPDLVEYCAAGNIDGMAPKLMASQYWPDGWYDRQQGKIDILVAGCGANAAARYAYLHPEARVTGIDLSEASLGHEAHLKEKHDLQNLTLHRLPLEDVGTLGETFDFVDTTGVLHHLPDPAAGLTALGKVLRPHGVVGIMVYGTHGRHGIYMMQELFTRMGLGQTDQDIAVVRETLMQLMPNHPVHTVFASHDSTYDAGLVDLFLHPLDRAYTVPQCLELLDSAGLVFQGWADNFYYHPDGQLQDGGKLVPRLQAMDEKERWAAMELIHGGQSTHAFFATRPERDAAASHIDLAGEAFWNYVPHRRISRVIQPDAATGRGPMIQRDPFLPLPLTDAQAMLFNQVNGESTVKRVMERSGIVENAACLKSFTRDFVSALWRMGYIRLDLPKAKD